jgi:LPXTG-motif cell wall-anchored protein
VALRSRMRLPPAAPTLAALTVGGVAALGAAYWLGVRRRRATV